MKVLLVEDSKFLRVATERTLSQGALFQTSYRMFSRFFKGKPSFGKTF